MVFLRAWCCGGQGSTGSTCPRTPARVPAHSRALPLSCPRAVGRQFICMGSHLGQWARAAGHAGSGAGRGRSEAGPHSGWWQRGGRGSGSWTWAAAVRSEPREREVPAARCTPLRGAGGPQAGPQDIMNYLVSVAAGVGYARPGVSGWGLRTGFEETALPSCLRPGTPRWERIRRVAFSARSAGPGNGCHWSLFGGATATETGLGS